MCGLVGVIAKRSYGFCEKDISTFQQLLYVDALRGDDATGVITVERDGDFHIDKAAITPEYFWYTYDQNKRKAQALQQGRALLGHNRKGTMGGYTDESAHPFVVNNTFAMTHNGTLYNHKKLADTVVDSEALAMVLQQAMLVVEGSDTVLDVLSDTLDEINGAYACVWYDQLTNKVQIIRNKERPLIIIETHDAFWYASEAEMLSWVLGRNNYTIVKRIIVEVDHLYTFNLNHGQIHVPVDEEIPVKKYTPVVITPYTTGTNMTTKTTSIGGIVLEVTKNTAKQLKTSLVGNKIVFKITDYVQKYPLEQVVNADRFCFTAYNKDLASYSHTIHGEFSLSETDIYHVDNVDVFVWIGTVTNVTYNRKNMSVDIIVDFCDLASSRKTTPKQKVIENENTITVH